MFSANDILYTMHLPSGHTARLVRPERLFLDGALPTDDPVLILEEYPSEGDRSCIEDLPTRSRTPMACWYLTSGDVDAWLDMLSAVRDELDLEALARTVRRGTWP